MENMDVASDLAEGVPAAELSSVVDDQLLPSDSRAAAPCARLSSPGAYHLESA